MCQRQVWDRVLGSSPPSAATPVEQYCVGLAYSMGQVGASRKPDHAAAAPWYRKAAEAGHPGAQNLLGYHYERGYGVPRDPTEGARWYRKAAAQGHADAMFNLGRVHDAGVGVAKDPGEALRWYKAAAERGQEEAKRALAKQSVAQRTYPGQELFEEGSRLYRGKDFAGAVKALARAADMGHPMAQAALGYQYEYGEGVAKDPVQAVRWYATAAAQGNSTAQKNLGQMYENGRGTAENWIEAARWYRRSAEQHDAAGEAALGRAYQFGIGVPQSRGEAVAWYRKAAAQGNSQAAYFARHLSDPRNNIGFRNEAEHQLVIGGKLRFGMGADDPAGITFRSSGERMAWLGRLRQQVDKSEAETMWNIRKREYDDCRRAEKSNCIDPGPRP